MTDEIIDESLTLLFTPCPSQRVFQADTLSFGDFVLPFSYTLVLLE